MKSVLMVLIIPVLFSCGIFKDREPVKQVVEIQTNAQCGECKDRIEGELNFTSGVVYAELDLSTKIVEVKYNRKRITPDEIRKVISEKGYSADSRNADEAAQKALPTCCQPGGHDD
ncbi:MAG: heavy-metal-associated domain-containing protein [Bacteroidota bacterium]